MHNDLLSNRTDPLPHGENGAFFFFVQRIIAHIFRFVNTQNEIFLTFLENVRKLLKL